MFRLLTQLFFLLASSSSVTGFMFNVNHMPFELSSAPSADDELQQVDSQKSFDDGNSKRSEKFLKTSSVLSNDQLPQPYPYPYNYFLDDNNFAEWTLPTHHPSEGNNPLGAPPRWLLPAQNAGGYPLMAEEGERNNPNSLPIIETPLAMSNPFWKILSRAGNLYRMFRRSPPERNFLRR